MSCVFDNTDFVRILLRQTDSTNNALRESLDDSTMGELPEYFTIVTSYQLAGRGQRGNSWESEPGKNLLFSTLLHPVFLKVEEQFRLSKVVSLAIVDTLLKYASGEPFSIKWPNDIYWGEKKIGGILIENDLQGTHLAHSIVGVGLNINQAVFLSDAPNPCSLIQVIGREVNTEEFLSRLMARLRVLYEQLRKGDSQVWTSLEQRYADYLFRREGFHSFSDEDGEFRARILRVDPDGRLFLFREDGTEKSYLFKEVEFLFKG